MKLFYDAEFTGLHQNSTLISIALVADNGESFYAEFSDYNKSQCDDWIHKNVLQHTHWLSRNDELIEPQIEQDKQLLSLCGNSRFILERLTTWLKQFSQITIWADCYAWDWVLFCQLFGGALQLPKQIFYMPGDIATLFIVKGYDADTKREDFARLSSQTANNLPQHHALKDAIISQACYAKLMAKD